MKSNKNKKLKYISVNEIIRLHKDILDETGGEYGILSRGDIEFITDFIKSQIYSMNIKDEFYLSALILRNIISGHPFVDGNKRTGIEATDLFLRKNGYYLEMTVKEGVEFALTVAKNETNLESIYDWIKSHSKKI